MIQCGVDANMPPVNIARIAGQKSLASQEKYISSEGLHHVAGSRAIHRRFHHVEGVKKKYEDELQEAKEHYCRKRMRTELGFPDGSAVEPMRKVRKAERGVQKRILASYGG